MMEFGTENYYPQAPPSPVILRLIDHLLHLPSPPQILFLPPNHSPLPESLLTLVQAMRIGITNPLAQLHCEPLPQTPTGVREFAANWGKVSTGMTGEGGRRIDAIVFGSGWQVDPTGIYGPILSSDAPGSSQTAGDRSSKTAGDTKTWTVHEYYFHILTSLLPNLMR